jgi:hypothetical protein
MLDVYEGRLPFEGSGLPPEYRNRDALHEALDEKGDELNQTFLRYGATPLPEE